MPGATKWREISPSGAEINRAGPTVGPTSIRPPPPPSRIVVFIEEPPSVDAYGVLDFSNFSSACCSSFLNKLPRFLFEFGWMALDPVGAASDAGFLFIASALTIFTRCNALPTERAACPRWGDIPKIPVSAYISFSRPVNLHGGYLCLLRFPVCRRAKRNTRQPNLTLRPKTYPMIHGPFICALF